ncbi:hypothetical protein NEF87_001493 [Candidatus Lokiarchaeum ossiferum]|uniref:PNPLA domain-containing protein n=1 Tax=Candidatus Lokiarchaeum ossiferum TaxID=2951803 RepID=A0ABY6HNV6_9ARCH|nr:hypothetical protein NEF87_001493 [Candidatus Lokiarchaeum sp. B-35]
MIIIRRVLVLKGGGIRGLLQLDSLRILENHYDEPICRIFDLITGTSVGAITGGVCALGQISMESYIDSFLRYFPSIFKKHWWSGIFKPVYQRKHFYSMWDAILGENPIYMRDCKTKFMCTAVNLCTNRTHFFKSWEDEDKDELLANQIAKSFAAPYFFGQFVDEKNKAVWVDGGAGTTNTPVDRAYAEVINQGWYKERTEIIILGTGYVDLSIPFEKAKKQGQLQQMLKFMSPVEGGLARIQSTLNKIRRMEIITKANPLITVKYFDTDIGKIFSGTDKIQYVQQYMSFGRVIAEQVERYLEDSKIPFH